MTVSLDVNGIAYQVTWPDQRLSLNDYLRQQTPFKGTKQACGEGGCGSCTVLCKTQDGCEQTIASCLALVGTLDGCGITTTEGLGSEKGGFHPIQQAFAKHHASQCGFCTPGFVMAVRGALGAHRGSAAGGPPSLDELKGGLDGNLCRCTGYRPIADACKVIFRGKGIQEVGQLLVSSRTASTALHQAPDAASPA